jgi:3-dehydroquinate synthase class II
MDNLQNQFNDLIKQMALAKIALEQLEQGADAVEVNFHTDTTENHGEY